MHVNKYHSNAYYYRKKLDKMLQDRQTLEAMRWAFDRMKVSWPKDPLKIWPYDPKKFL